MNTETKPIAPYEQKPEGMTDQCTICYRWFKSKPALNTHKIRAHGKGWSTTGNLRGKKKARQVALEKKRAYNARTRAANRAKGLTSSGKPRIRPLRKKHPAFGVPWTPERRARFEKTWRAKNKAKLQPINHGKNSHVEPLEDPREFINHCPHCGKNLVAYYLAAGAERRRHGH